MPVPRIDTCINSVVICSDIQFIVQLPKLLSLFHVESKSKRYNNGTYHLHGRQPTSVLSLILDHSATLLALILQVEPTLLLMTNLNPIGLYSFFKEPFNTRYLALFLSLALGCKVLLKVLIMKELVAILRPRKHVS